MWLSWTKLCSVDRRVGGSILVRAHMGGNQSCFLHQCFFLSVSVSLSHPLSLSAMGKCLRVRIKTKKKRETEKNKTQIHRGEHVKMEAQAGVMNLQIKGCKSLPAASRHYSRGMGQILPENLLKKAALLTL